MVKEMEIIVTVFLGIGVAMLGMISVELSHYIKGVEDGNACESCSEKSECIAIRPCGFRGYNWVDEWMLFSFLKIRKYCPFVSLQLNKRMGICFLLCGVFATTLFWSKGFGEVGILYGVSGALLFAISVVDWNTQYIPFEYTLMIMICGLIHLFADFSNWYDYVIGLIAVSGFLLLVDKIGTRILSKKYEGEELGSVIGDGDIKLMAATGLLLGWKLNFLALGIGCIAGSVIHLIRMKIKGSGSVLALGPYLSLGVYITMICGEQLISWYLNMLGVKPI